MKNNSHKIIISVVLLVIVVFIAGYVYFAKYVLSMGSRAQAEASKKQENEEMIARISKRKPRDVAADIAKAKTFLLKEGEEYTLIELIESRCREVGITCAIQPIGIMEAVDLSPSFGYLNMVIDAEGNFAKQLQFSLILETLPYQTLLSRIDLKTEEGSVQSNQNLSQAILDDENASTTATTTVRQVIRSNKIWSGSYDLRVTTIKQK
jgi:hypothetical protein